MKFVRASLLVLMCGPAIAVPLGACGGDEGASGDGDAAPDAVALPDAARADTGSGGHDAALVDGAHDDADAPDAGTNGDASGADASVPDATGIDATSPDAHLADANAPDTHVADANAPDAGLHDGNAPDTSLPDTSLPDASLPDASLPDASLPDASLPDTSLPDAAVPVRVRLVDLAPLPAGLKVDVCAQRQGGPTVTTPLLLGAGGGAISYPSISGYVDVAPGFYDFRFVPGTVTDCSATAELGFIGNVSVTASTTLAVYQYSFGLPAYNAAVFIDTTAPTTTMANVRVHDSAQGSAPEDFWQTSDGSSYTLFAPAIAFGAQSIVVPLAPGSHGFEARSSTGTVLATLVPQALAAGTSWEGFTFLTGAATQGLVLCSDAALLPSASRACLGP